MSALPEAASALREGELTSRLERFLGDRLRERIVVRDLRRCSSGFSWTTYSLAAIAPSGLRRELILQMGPPTGLLAPYSARPQALALSALANSDVPVAELIGWSDEEEHLGSPFFVCSRVDGEPIVPWGLERVPGGERRRLAETFVDILGSLHAPEAPVAALMPLRPQVCAASAVQIEVRAWVERIRRWRTRSYPLLTWAGKWLLDNAPPAPRVCIVHGDFRLGNFLRRGGCITAVLDWEMAHPGHPLEDLGWLLLPMYNKGSPLLFAELPRQAVIQRYSARSGIAVEPRSLHYFECLGMFKSVALTLAAMDSYLRRGFDDMRVCAMATSIASLTRRLDKSIDEAPG